MGASWSNQNTIPCEKYRILTYNVEWGFINIPKDIHLDSCGHIIPHNKTAQIKHLQLIAKNIGLLTPHICFLQEIGSLEAIQLIANHIKDIFDIDYDVHYSNTKPGYQGVGLLIQKDISPKCVVENIPNFKLDRALGVTMTTESNTYKIIGTHLKSLCDHKYDKDVGEQKNQIQSIFDWTGNNKNVIICGDFNNIPSSEPIQKVIKANLESILDSNKYEPNITGDKLTEFSKNKNGKEYGSVIDYIFKTKSIEVISAHIINFERETKNPIKNMRSETSDHLPVLGIFRL